MKLLIALLAAAGLSGCVAYGGGMYSEPYGYSGYSGYPGYGYDAPAYGYPGTVYGGVVVQRGYDRGDRGDRGYRRGYGDRDRDGVPNRYDRDRDGDGVPNRMDRAPNNPRRY